jgi:hypothetical protein
MITFGTIGRIQPPEFSYGGVVRQQPGRKVRRRTRRRATRSFLGRMRRNAARGVLGRTGRGIVSRIRRGTAGPSSRLRRLVLAVVLLGVALLPYPTQGAVGVPPASACRPGCRAGSVPGMVSWTVPLSGSWDVVPGLTGTVPASGLAYVSVGDGLAAVGAGLTVSGYSSRTGALRWRVTLAGFPAGAAIVSVRTWSGEVTVGVSYPAVPTRANSPVRSNGAAFGLKRTEVALSDATGAQTGRYPAAEWGGAVAGSPQDTVIVGTTAVTSYDNATGHIRWQRPTGPVAQAWRTDGSFLYVAVSASGFVGSAPVTALRRIDLATGAELLVLPLESLSYSGELSAAFDGTVLFSSATGVTAYGGTSGATLWTIRGAVPEGTDPRSKRIYLTKGSNLVSVDPLTGRITATASGSAVDGSAGVYVVRGGIALGLDQGPNGDAWGYDIAAQRVTMASAGLPWPHYFVDLAGVGGSADPASGMVVIAACTRLAPSALTQPTSTATPSSTSPGPTPTATLGPTPPTQAATPARTATPTRTRTATPAQTSSASSATSTSPSTTVSPATSASAGSAPSPNVSPSASPSTGQGCLDPELVALSL